MVLAYYDKTKPVVKKKKKFKPVKFNAVRNTKELMEYNRK